MVESLLPFGTTHPPILTVCVPTVDRLLLLQEALASVAGQTFRDCELLIGDNSGNPVYGTEVDALVSQLSLSITHGVRVLHQDRTLSVVEHTNTLIRAARGQYIVYLPDDDRLRETCLERLIAPVLLDSTVDIVFSDHWTVRADGTVDAALTASRTRSCGLRKLSPGRVPSGDVMAVALRQSWNLQAMLVRKTLFDAIPFRPEKEQMLDFDFQLRLAKACPSLHVVYCPERLVDYRLHPAQATRTWVGEEEALFHLECIASLKECEPVSAEHAKLYRRKVAHRWGSIASCYWASREWRLACRSSLTAIATDPSWAKGYMWLVRPLVPTGLQRRMRARARSFLVAREARVTR